MVGDDYGETDEPSVERQLAMLSNLLKNQTRDFR